MIYDEAFPFFRGQSLFFSSFAVMLWMDETLHLLETMGNHSLLVFTGKSSFQAFLGGAKWIASVHSSRLPRCSEDVIK